MGCSITADKAFEVSQRNIRGGMTLGEAFDSGLAKYLLSASPKNVVGATLPEHQPVSTTCTRFVFDISHSSGFQTRVYCERNAPSSRMIAPPQYYSSERVNYVSIIFRTPRGGA